MSDYTPTTEDVHACFLECTNWEADDFHGKSVSEVSNARDAEFDRWLAKVKREAVAEWQLERLAATIKATREGYNMGENK